MSSGGFSMFANGRPSKPSANNEQPEPNEMFMPPATDDISSPGGFGRSSGFYDDDDDDARSLGDMSKQSFNSFGNDGVFGPKTTVLEDKQPGASANGPPSGFAGLFGKRPDTRSVEPIPEPPIEKAPAQTPVKPPGTGDFGLMAKRHDFFGAAPTTAPGVSFGKDGATLPTANDHQVSLNLSESPVVKTTETPVTVAAPVLTAPRAGIFGSIGFSGRRTSETTVAGQPSTTKQSNATTTPSFPSTFTGAVSRPGLFPGNFQAGPRQQQQPPPPPTDATVDQLVTKTPRANDYSFTEPPPPPVVTPASGLIFHHDANKQVSCATTAGTLTARNSDDKPAETLMDRTRHIMGKGSFDDDDEDIFVEDDAPTTIRFSPFGRSLAATESHSQPVVETDMESFELMSQNWVQLLREATDTSAAYTLNVMDHTVLTQDALGQMYLFESELLDQVLHQEDALMELDAALSDAMRANGRGDCMMKG